MQRLLVGGLAWGTALAVAVSLIGLAACGGQPTATPAPTPIPSVAGLQLPPGLTDEQKAAVLQVPDPGDSTKPLATLVEAKALTADELAQELREDASLAALEADAVARGFGKIASATDLVYDNGVTVTAAPLDMSSGDVLRFAYRSSPPKSHYLLAELDRVAGRLTTYDENGTVSIDLATGESSAVESPTAHHSCSFLHCFNTAMEIVGSAPLYGWLQKKVCEGCGEAVANAWIAGTPPGEALLGVSCVACLATLTAALSASLYVCIDDPCGFCMSDSCGESDSESESDPPIYCGSQGIFEADPETGSTAGRYWIEGEAYVCEGITTRKKYYWFGSEIAEYRGTQCVLETGVTRRVQRCPYGCAPPASGDSASRTCKAAPSVCDPANCTGTTVTAGTQTCSLQNGTYAVTQPVQVRGCVDAPDGNGQVCGVVATRSETTACGPCGCASDGKSCRCLTDHPLGDPVCRQVAGTYKVTQDWTHCDWVEANQQCLESIVPHVTICGTAGCSTDGKSCGAATQCDPTTCQGRVLVSSVCTPNARGQGGTVAQVYRQSACNPAGTACESFDSQVTLPCIAGCATDGKSCAGPGGGRGGCVPSECEQPDEPIGNPRCVLRPDDQKWILERDYTHYECSPVQGGDDATCEQMTITKFEQFCPAGCATDAKSCASSGGSTVTGGVWEAVSADSYQRCLRCTIRLTGAGGTYEVMSGTDGGYSIDGVADGTFRLERKCGSTWVGAHAPWNTALGYAAMTVPASGSVDILVPNCP